MANYFVDTEFTDLPWNDRSHLLWIAVVDESGSREFSAVVEDCPLDSCSSFVRANVLPKANVEPIKLSRDTIAKRLAAIVDDAPTFWAWCPSLEDIALLGGHEEAPYRYEHYRDWDHQLMVGLFEERPELWPPNCEDLHSLADDSAIELPLNPNPHHPLSDARWGREVWRLALQARS